MMQPSCEKQAVLACVDRSIYSASVCDHAAWFSDALARPITALHVGERGQVSPPPALRRQPPIAAALERFHDYGIADITVRETRGRFATVGLEMAKDACLTVMGKRGVSSDGDRRALGSSVYPMLRGTDRPVCLVSRYYLPVVRALVLLDDDPAHRRTVEVVAGYPTLARLKLDLVMLQGDASNGEPKLSWAREMLGASEARVFEMHASSPDEAVSGYIKARGYDLLILSREIVLRNIEDPVAKVDNVSFWSWRAPVLVC